MHSAPAHPRTPAVAPSRSRLCLADRCANGTRCRPVVLVVVDTDRLLLLHPPAPGWQQAYDLFVRACARGRGGDVHVGVAIPDSFSAVGTHHSISTYARQWRHRPVSPSASLSRRVALCMPRRPAERHAWRRGRAGTRRHRIAALKPEKAPGSVRQRNATQREGGSARLMGRVGGPVSSCSTRLLAWCSGDRDGCVHRLASGNGLHLSISSSP